MVSHGADRAGPPANSKEELIEHRDVTREVVRLHGRPQDLDEGDLLHRLDRFDFFVKKSIPMADIDLNEFALCKETVLDYVKIYHENSSYPPIVFDAIDNSMIDGLHRANALNLLGITHVEAYVGIEKYADPHWSPLGDEDEDMYPSPEEG